MNINVNCWQKIVAFFVHEEDFCYKWRMALHLMKNSYWVSFLFLVFSFLLYFYNYPSSFSAKNMATEEAPKSLYDFTVKVFLFFAFWAMGFMLYLYFFVFLQVYVFEYQLWLDYWCGLMSTTPLDLLTFHALIVSNLFNFDFIDNLVVDVDKKLSTA